jgi:hypothetical protein
LHVVNNKNDLKKNRKVEHSRARVFLNKNNFGYSEANAKADARIADMMCVELSKRL